VQPPAAHLHLQVAGGEGADEDHRLRAAWLMLMKPPAPASRGPKRLTFRLPCASACARPSTAMSSPPPS
jgi:hypothetical protein